MGDVTTCTINSAYDEFVCRVEWLNMNDKMNMLSYYKIVIETVNIALYILKQFKIVLINNIERLAFEFFDIHFDPFINMSQL